METTFRTKTGHVEITRDQLRVVRIGARGQAAQRMQGDSKSRTLFVYAVVVVILVGQGAVLYARSGSLAWPVVLWFFAGWIVYQLIKSRNFSMVPVVSRESATRIESIRGIPGLTRDRIVVHFDDEGKPSRRFILMPGVLQRGAGEVDRAMEVLAAHAWPVDQPESPHSF